MLSLDLEFRFTVTFLLQILFVEKVDFRSNSQNHIVDSEQYEEEGLLLG
jgi:hypothetical protein